jgi:hypothetical protein
VIELGEIEKPGKQMSKGLSFSNLTDLLNAELEVELSATRKTEGQDKTDC